MVFVRNQWSMPSVQLFAEMVVEIDSPDAAVHKLAALNHDIEGVKFALHGHTLVASVDLPAAPFAAEHLQMVLAHLCDVVSRHDAAWLGALEVARSSTPRSRCPTTRPRTTGIRPTTTPSTR